MYEITNAIMRTFDIKKLKSLCNQPSCNKKPEKEFFIYEYRTKRNIGIAKIYLCKKHIEIARNLMVNLKNIEPTMVIESDEKDI